MSLKNFFKTGNKSATGSGVTSPAITVDRLKTLIPIRSLSEEKLQAFATDRKADVYPANSTLFTEGEKNDCAYYLLQGIVVVSDSTGKKYEVDADTPQAKFPLCSGIKHTLTVIAKTDVCLLRVSQTIMTARPPAFQDSTTLKFPKQLADSRLLQSFSQYYLEEDMEVPSLPDIALKLRKAIQSDIGIADAANIIQLDPIMTAKLIQVANCPLYLARNPVKTCFDAVNRIGLRATQNLITTLSLKQIFQANVPMIRKLMDKVWKHSIYISCICYALAAETQKAKPEEALLAGLVSDIGLVPFLNYAAKLPTDYYTEQEIIQAMPYVKGTVGTYILNEWNFPEELIGIPVNADDWYRHNGNDLTLTDIVMLAKFHSKIGKPGMAYLPAITSLPAVSKLGQVLLSPENSLRIIHDAHVKIAQAKQIFST
ncbi:MAG: histidine kinase [Gammaproteobacteria bacterium HGW-Gammaproteobacteria-3]|nr:MAG: histidine kinase [Gammaproteobacteria bacterium HGW-Gammaproteobacteria-3]